MDSVADGTWTNKDVAFDVEVKDGTTGLVKVTYELDGQPVDSPQTWDAAAPEKKAVTKKFSFDTSAASSQGHVLKVTAENAKGKDATLTKYILIDKGKPAISLHVKGDETKTVENTVYKAPFEIEAAVMICQQIWCRFNIRSMEYQTATNRMFEHLMQGSMLFRQLLRMQPVIRPNLLR